MSAFVEDFGAAHPQTKQIRMLITGLPYPLPGSWPIFPVESGEIVQMCDTFDTKDGEAHEAGPNSQSYGLTFSLYESAITEREYMEKWFSLRSSPFGKATVIVEYPYADGTKGAAFRLTRVMCTGRRTGGSGQAGAATTTYTLKYKRGNRV